MSDDPTFTNTIQDALGGVAIVAFIVVALLWAPELARLFA